jgi:phosphatidylinositol kinase/protein kinase (PI-3  family)
LRASLLAHAIRAQGVAELFIFCAVCCEYRIVRDNVSEQIRECLEAAENCARKAATLADSSPFKQDFLNLEQRWLELARRIEFGENLATD